MIPASMVLYQRQNNKRKTFFSRKPGLTTDWIL
ncbi:unnamed protein product [Ectocarpus sp. 12 AP-2014]